MSKFEIILTIINVLAIIAIPIAAVFLGQKLQDRSQKRRDKLEIFRALMMNRGIGWSVESVHALNLIDVVFSDDNTVRMRWKEYYTQLCIQSPNEMQRKQVQEAQDMKYGLTVITEENKKGEKKIPYVCKNLNVPCIDILGLCEKEGWQF